MRISIAREGYPFIAVAAIPAVALWAAVFLYRTPVLWVAAVGFTALTFAMTAFFRDPDRLGPRGTGLFIAPADGRVVDISKAAEDDYLHRSAMKVSIFLSLFDVHVNRYPVSGQVEHSKYAAGRFEPAWRLSASRSNERMSTGIRGRHPVLVRQIAGLAAKRIVTYCRIGDKVKQGQRMGLIRFGSRVDVFLPDEAVIDVRVGQKAVGGVTVIAHLSNGSGER